MHVDWTDKKLEILLVAEKLFASEGFDGTSIRAIAKIAKINIAMVSYYFGSKEKLLEAIVVYRIGGMRMHLENIVKADLTPFQKIDAAIAHYVQQVNSNRNIHQILHSESSNKKRNLDIDFVNEVKLNNIRLMKIIVEEGQSLGLFQKSIQVELFSPIIIGSLMYFNMNRDLYTLLFQLKTEEDFDNYILNDLTKHIQRTIKALLVYEK
ncbi:MAG: AcrR family transcriptional regulator [Flavobacterium sp.]|jgi:AcrR family transcriptional regulator